MDITTLKEKCCSFFMILLTTVLLAGTTAVKAVDDLELEGNILNNGMTDWEDIFDVSGSNVPTEADPLPDGYIEAVFIRDFVPGKSGPDETTFTTGSKDTLNITPGWECTRSNNVNDKTDIVNAYATAAEINGEVVVYFALERYSNEGEGNIGFWFLKDGSVGCALNGKNGSFTGNHMDGDLLIVSEFTNGGTVSNIFAYKWVGGAGGFLDPTPIAGGSQCVGGGAGQDLCAIVNGNLLEGFGPGTDIPWLTETKQPGNTPSNDLHISEFFEGKINLSTLGLVGCFTQYMGVTRSSTSLTATIFDYALGDFNLCSIDVAKACTVSTLENPNPVINADGDQVVTTFDVTVTNDGAGTVSNVTIEEDIVLSSGESCKLISIDGAPVGPTDISDGLPVEIAASLAANDSVIAQVRCETNDNPLDNIVTARAKSVASEGDADLSDSYDMAENELCALAVSPMIDVNKVCTDVRLTTVSDILTMEVEVDIDLTNTSDEKLVDVLISNVVGDSQGGDPITLQHVDMNGDPLADFDGDLAPGETVFFKSIYVPTVVTNSGTDPATASFQDRVDASGVGAISGATADDFSTADCPLCPPHTD